MLEGKAGERSDGVSNGPRNLAGGKGGPHRCGVCGGRHKRPDFHERRQVAHKLVEATNLCAAKPSSRACAPACRLPARTNTGPPFELPDWDKGLFIAKAVMEQSNRPVMQ